MDLTKSINNYLDNESQPVDSHWVEEMGKKYPFFTLPATLMLSRENGLTPQQLETVTRKLALNVANPATLMERLRPEAAGWMNFYPAPPETPKLTTNEAIDHFIDAYGKPDPDEEALLTRLIFNPTPDYAQLLSLEEEKDSPTPNAAPEGSQDALINDFILKSRERLGHFPPIDGDTAEKAETDDTTPADTTPVAPPEENAPAMLSESLAKIYIKQRRYAKAFEIINGLSLKYPEKSIYFADQLRFLRKLMLNQRHIDKKQTK